MRRFWIGLLAAILLPYVMTLAWSGSVGGASGDRLRSGSPSGNGQNGRMFGGSSAGRSSLNENDPGSGDSENILLGGGKKIYLDNGQSGYMDLESYLVGVVARQISADYELEAVKAQAIIARTYIYRQMDGKTEAKESELGLEALGETQMEKMWGQENFLEYYGKMKQAVQETAGMVMAADNNGDGVEGDGSEGNGSEGNGSEGDRTGRDSGTAIMLIEPLFHQVSAGYTRDGGESYAYLKSVESLGDLEADGYLAVLEWEPKEIVQMLQSEVSLTENQVLETIQLVSREESGYVNEMQIGSHLFTGDEVRTLLGLPSSSFTLEIYEGRLRAVGKGIGHGYGLSQYGAHRMALDGKMAEEILKYYYQNITIISSEK